MNAATRPLPLKRTVLVASLRQGGSINIYFSSTNGALWSILLGGLVALLGTVQGCLLTREVAAIRPVLQDCSTLAGVRPGRIRLMSSCFTLHGGISEWLGARQDCLSGRLQSS